MAGLGGHNAKDDISPWRQHVEKFVDPQVVLEAGADAFTEGQWRGQRRVLRFRRQSDGGAQGDVDSP